MHFGRHGTVSVASVSDLRVALGPTDVAGTSSALATGFRTRGVDAEVVVWKPGHPFGFRADRTLGRVGRGLYGLALPARRNVVHYQYGSTWLPWIIDARWARLCRRTIVVGYHGDDCRLSAVASREGWPLAELDIERDDEAVRERMRKLSSVSNAAIVADLEIASYVHEHFPRLYVVPLPVLPSPGVRRLPKRAASVVLHAPSDQRIKGTELIEAAVTPLTKDGRVEFRVVTSAPHAEVRDAIAEADIVVDQLRSASASVFALEALGAGVPVLSRVDARALASFHQGLPIVPVTPDTLQAELVRLLDDPARCHALGERGRAYVAETHAADRVAEAMCLVYEHARTARPGVYEATVDGISERSAGA